jgi:hypothetical protein
MTICETAAVFESAALRPSAAVKALDLVGPPPEAGVDATGLGAAGTEKARAGAARSGDPTEIAARR